MKHSGFTELRRRSVLKSLIWRIIGVVWTWIGAYIIILIVPPTWNNAAIIATLIVVYHHSTRMIMYYFYERIWTSISWGKYDSEQGSFQGMSMHDKLIWTIGSSVSIGVIFFLIIYVTPFIKNLTAS
ncbi:MAG: DUF2061 domain-containing protein [Desulfobulbaceae bacterium]|nr:DUF2061 domain-containing protein [Desulfobulbaceae bacterium]